MEINHNSGYVQFVIAGNAVNLSCTEAAGLLQTLAENKLIFNHTIDGKLYVGNMDGVRSIWFFDGNGAGESASRDKDLYNIVDMLDRAISKARKWNLYELFGR